MEKKQPPLESKSLAKQKKFHKKSKSTDKQAEIPEDTTGATTQNAIIDKKGEVFPPGTTESAIDRKARKRAIREARRKQSSQQPEDAAALPGGEKRKRSNEEDTREEEIDISTVVEPPKKKRKNRTVFADPRVDAALNPQSRKGLEYAFMQFNKPKKWKFNKAKQNWVVRNIWIPEAISEAYFSLAVKYLTGVQGGSRTKLIETCRSYLKEPEANTPEPSVITDSVSVAPLKSILKPTPGPLIGGPLVSTGNTIATDGHTTPLNTVIPPSIHSATRRTRAQTLLDALEFRSNS